MAKVILITGSTDGIGFAAAKKLAAKEQNVLLHGRNPVKLDRAKAALLDINGGKDVETYQADLSDMAAVHALAEAVLARHDHLDVLINNAGIFKTSHPITKDGLDVRFVVNTLAPYELTRRLLPIMDARGRVVNLSSAAQAPIDLKALRGDVKLGAGQAYAQSKLAITMWSADMAGRQNDGEQKAGPSIIAVNPGSLLGTNMVKEAYGMEGKDMNIGADILERAALSDQFEGASGRYFDNDTGRFAAPHSDALDAKKMRAVTQEIENILAGLL